MAAAEPELPVLALNSGSSSLKFGLYELAGAEPRLLLSGEAEAIGAAESRFSAKDAAGTILVFDRDAIADVAQALIRIIATLAQFKTVGPAVIGHRIVHGGPRLRRHCLITPAVLRELESAASFAPLHAPAALSVIRLAQSHFPGVAQAACFDTDFHASMPDLARILPLPRALLTDGIQRYGFHGLSCESIIGQLGEATPRRLIIAHLGNGASITAVRNGVSVDTSMGLTPSGGVVMGTRSGDLDPGLLIHLLRWMKLDADALEDLVDRRSGLAGISGIGSDMRTLRHAAPAHAEAALAIEIFCASVRKQVAAMMTVLDGLDLLVFTGGIGENDAASRAEICAGLSWSGLILDAERNRSGAAVISAETSPIAIRVLPSLEDQEIARHSHRLYRQSIPAPAAE